MALDIVLPDSKDIQNLVEGLNNLVDVEKQRLSLEEKIFNLLRYDHLAESIVFSAVVEGISQKGITMLQLNDVQSCTLSIQPVDSRNNPAPVDGAPTWTVSDATILTISVDSTGLTATITAAGALGVSQVNVSADADLGSGVTTITGTLDVTVVASQATTIAINPGTPTP